MILQPSSYCKTYVLLIFTTPGDKSKPLNLPTKQTAQIKSVEAAYCWNWHMAVFSSIIIYMQSIAALKNKHQFENGFLILRNVNTQLFL